MTEFTITIAAGMTSATGMFTLAPLDDDTNEPIETVLIIGTTMASGLSVAPTAGLIVAITDNDDTPQVSLVLTPASISENGGTSTVTATLDRPSSEDTTIAVAAAAGTDTVATDFSLSGTTLTIAAGDMTSTGTVTIAATNNEMIDGAKYVTVSGTVMNTQGSTAPASQTLTIADDDVLATGVILAVSPGSVPESAGATVVTVTATLNGLAGTDPVPVAVSVTGGTAAAATDFGAVTDFMITIPANTKSETGMFTLTPIDDLIDEPDETVEVRGTAAGLSGSQSTVTIEDNDDTPQVMLVLTPASIPENGGSSTVTATLDHPSSEETVVTISAAPVGSADANDFTLSGNRVLRIAVGQTMSAGIVTIEAEDNTTGHPDRVVTVSGSATNGLAIGQPDPASLTITDDEQTSTGFTIAASPMSVSEDATASARRVTVTATLDAAAREEATVVTLSVRDGTAIAGTDFTEVQDVELTIQPRATEGTATFDLIPIDDTIDEPDETVKIVGVSADLGSDTSGGIDVQIEDDDATPQVTLVLAPALISENNGTSTVTATLDGRSSEATEITVSAVPVGSADATDFSLSGTTLTIAAGDMTSTGTVTIEAVDNAIDHPDRELTVSGSAVNDLGIVQPAVKTLTIEDNEVTSTLVTLSISPTNVTEGDGGQTVTVTAELNAAARETDAEVSLKVSELTAKEGVDFTEVPNFTLTIPAGVTTGTAEFTLSVIDDDIDEPVETLEVEGRSLTDDLEVDEMSKDLPMTITDNDDSPQVTLTATPAQIGEDGGTTTIAATLDRPSSDFTTVTVSVTPAANASNADFSVSSNIYLEIRAGDTSSTGDTVTVTAIDNEVDDTGSKTLSVTATVRNDVGFVAPDPLNLPIIDDEAESNNIVLRGHARAGSGGDIGDRRDGHGESRRRGAGRGGSGRGLGRGRHGHRGDRLRSGERFHDLDPCERDEPDGGVHAFPGRRRYRRTGRDRVADRDDDGQRSRGWHGFGDHHGRRRDAAGDAGSDAGRDLREQRFEHRYGNAGPSVDRDDDDHGDGGAGEPGGCGGLHAERDDPDHRGGGDVEHRGGDDRRQRQRDLHREQEGDDLRHGREQPGDRAADSAGADHRGGRYGIGGGDVHGFAGGDSGR